MLHRWLDAEDRALLGLIAAGVAAGALALLAGGLVLGGAVRLFGLASGLF